MSEEEKPTEYYEGYNDGWEMGLFIASCFWCILFLLATGIRYLFN